MNDDNTQQEEERSNASEHVKKYLTLNEHTSVEEVANRLQDDQCIVLYIHLHRSFTQKYTMNHIETVFGSARLPELLGLKIDMPDQTAAERREITFPVNALSSVLTHSIKLEYLIFNLKLGGSYQDFRDWGSTISRLGSLQCVGLTLSLKPTDGPQIPPTNLTRNVLQMQHPPIDDENSPNLLDPFIKALSGIPTLTDVIIKGDVLNPMEASLGTLKSSTLADLCRSPRLRSLYLFLFVLSDADATSMFQALQQNSVLKELCINCSLGLRGSRALSQALEHNATLQELILIISDYDHNTAPTKQSNEGDGLADGALEKHIEHEIASGLGKSRSIQEFLFQQGGPGDMSDGSLEAFRDMIRSNYVLKKLSLRMGKSPVSKLLDDQIQFYVALNKAERGELLGTASAVASDKKWVDMLEKVSPDLSHLFYFLSLHPSLCNATERGQAISKPSDRKRKSSAAGTVAQGTAKRKRLYRAVKYKGFSYRG